MGGRSGSRRDLGVGLMARSLAGGAGVGGVLVSEVSLLVGVSEFGA